MARYRLEERIVQKAMAFGISSHVPDYRLCWSLNRALGLELARRRADIVEEINGQALHYTVFEQRDEEDMMRWALVCNTCGRRKLVPERKEADFFLVVDHETATRDPNRLARPWREIMGQR